MKTSYKLDQLIRLIALLITGITLTACSSAPRHVEASVPLVMQKNKFDDANLVPSEYWSVLNDDSADHLSHPSYQVSVGPKYTSAMGLTCRPLQIKLNEFETRKRVTCLQVHEDNRGNRIHVWYLTKSILQVKEEVDI